MELKKLIAGDLLKIQADLCPGSLEIVSPQVELFQVIHVRDAIV